MTLTEYFAKKWLKKCGYKRIEFRSWTTPDFVADGDYYEVKKLNGRSVVFSDGQFGKLKKLKNVIILLYDCRDTLIDTIPFSEFKEDFSECRGYNVVGAHINLEEEASRLAFEELLSRFTKKVMKDGILSGKSRCNVRNDS
jgi:hypothetical protein